MKISKQQLIEMGACESIIKRFVEQTNNTDEPVEVSSLIGGKDTYSDLLWLAGETLSAEKIVRFACDVALINIDLIKPYTDEFDLIIDFLNNPTDDAAARTAYATARTAADTRATATRAAYTARTARTAARAAYYAARAAATHTARTTYTACTAYYAAIDAADDNKKKIDQLLIELFNEGE